MIRIVKILTTALLLSPITGVWAGAAEVILVPADPVVAVGGIFTVDITISLDAGAGEQLAGGVIDLGYDDSLVEIRDVSIDPYWDFLPAPGSQTGPGLWESIGFDVFVNPPAAANAPIATVTLEALAAGTSQLAVLGSSQFFSATAQFFPALTGASFRVNTPPTAEELTVGTDEDTAVAVTLAGSDGDGDDLTYTVTAGPVHGTLSGTAPDLTYTPAVNFYGSDGFAFRVSDGNADSNSAGVSITVTAVNDPPATTNDSYATAEDTPLTVAAPGVLDNDTDAEGGALTAALDAGTANGALALNPDGSFTYTPDADFTGGDSFTYLAGDGEARSGTATVTILVGPVNDPPTAYDDAYATHEDTPLYVAAPGILGNDTDIESGILTAVLDAGPSNGTLSLNPNGAFSYTPNTDFSGTDSFTYHAGDGQMDSGVAVVTVTVASVNDPPAASSDAYETGEDAPLAIAAPGVLANDADVENNPLVAVLDAGPINGTLTIEPDGSFTYTPHADFSGPDSFTYHADDGEDDSSVATVTIYVGAVNDAPVLEPIGPYSAGEGQSLTITVNADDPDGDDLAFEAGDLPSGAQFAPSEGSFSWTPNAGSSGNYRVLFRVSDSGRPPLGAYEYVTITVGSVNRPPVLAPIGPGQAAEGDVLSFEISAVDPEGDNLSFDAENLPAGAGFDEPSRTFSWPTRAGDAGNYEVTFSVTDDGDPAESATEKVTITIGDVNRPPAMDPVGSRNIVEGDTLVINLTATDPEGNALFFQCDEMPDGAVFDPDSQVFSWTTLGGDAGTYPLTFTVTDDGTPPESDAVSAAITVLRDPAANRAPEADAGPDLAVYAGDAVTLNGSNSFDPDAGDVLSYLWEQVEGDPVDLAGSRSALASFTAPDVDPEGQALGFRLTVTDPLGRWDEDTGIVNVIRSNRPPTADAGDDQGVREDRDTPIVLDGSGSGDPDAGDTLTYFWEQIGGEPVALTTGDQSTASFATPDVGVGGQAFEFRLTVTDAGSLKAQDVCIVNVTWVNAPAVADAGENLIAEEGTTVLLDGSGSFDPDGGIAAWRWKQTDTSGHPVALSDPTAEKTTFVAPAVDAETLLSFELMVADTDGLADTGDPVSVTVYDNGVTDFAAGTTCTNFPSGRALGLECGQGGHLTLLNIYDTVEDYMSSGGRFTLDTRYGLIEIEIRQDTPGTAATITLYLTDPLPAEISWHQYDPAGGWLDISSALSRNMANRVLFNADRTTVTLTLTDNGQYDQDATPGVLRTVGGLGASSAAVSTEESSGGGGGGSGCFIDTITFR
jgi:VCBS repeat-containing protein